MAGHHPCAGAGRGKWQAIAHAQAQGGASGRSSPMHWHRAEQMAGHRPCICAGRGKRQIIAHAQAQDGAKGGHRPCTGAGRGKW